VDHLKRFSKKDREKIIHSAESNGALVEETQTALAEIIELKALLK
jgi:hypothetical protein